MRNDTLSQACSPMERNLEHSMVPDPEGAAASVVKGIKTTFTSAPAFTAPRDTSAFNSKRCRCVTKHLGATNTALDAGTGKVHAHNSGNKYSLRPVGTPLDGSRCIDTFVIRDGPIVETLASNASAEWLLDRARLGEAPS